MNLSEKIEEIKRQPEHIRLRYVWFFVAVSMVAVVAIWILSIKANVGNVSSEITNMRSASDLNDVSEKVGEQKEMLQSVFENGKEAVNGVAEKTQSPEVSNNNLESKTADAPEKSEISNVPNTAPDGEVAPNMFPKD